MGICEEWPHRCSKSAVGFHEDAGSVRVREGVGARDGGLTPFSLGP